MSNPTWSVHPEGEQPPPEIVSLAETVSADGGTPLAVYREPLGGAWQIFALLPIKQVVPTPFQRDLSRAHARRLQDNIGKMKRFIDPVVAVRAGDGTYWTPNGNHRREALRRLKASAIPVILIAETEVAYRILALNTEKAHNLKEKSLEVIRMYRALLEAGDRRPETDLQFEFEEPHFITLGLIYAKKPRFSGSAFAPVVRRVDKFMKKSLDQGYEIRQRRAAQVEQVDAVLADRVAELKRRGVSHPYAKNYLLARCNPLGRARKTLPSFEEALSRLETKLKTFDLSRVRLTDVAFTGGAE